MKNFVKAMDKNGSEFLYLKPKFPGIGRVKIKEGIMWARKLEKSRQHV
jgi:hypothetical protein